MKIGFTYTAEWSVFLGFSLLSKKSARYFPGLHTLGWAVQNFLFDFL